MWAKGMLIIGCGIGIDFLQAAFAWMFLTVGAGLQAVTPAGGGVAGAALGASICWNSSTGIISGLVAAGKCGAAGFAAGGLLSAVGIPLGTALALISGVCISLTFGAGFIMLLSVTGMFYPGYIWAVFVGEAIPGLDVLPGWTFLAIRCVLKKNAEQTSGIAAVASGIASAVLSPASATGGLGSFARGISNMKAETGVIARSSPIVNNLYKSEPVENIAEKRQQLVADIRPRTNYAKA